MMTKVDTSFQFNSGGTCLDCQARKSNAISNHSGEDSNKNQLLECRPTLVLIEPRLLTRQCLSFWLEHRASDLELRTFASSHAAIEAAGQDEIVDLILWSVGARSVASAPCRLELQDLLEHFPATPLVLLADRDDPSDVTEALRLGIRGYVPTSSDRQEVWEILRFVRAGGTYVPASALVDAGTHDAASVSRPCSKAEKPRALRDLTPREMDVIERLRQGKPNKIIAHELQISESTVKVFVHRILTKLGAINRTEVAYLFQD